MGGKYAQYDEFSGRVNYAFIIKGFNSKTGTKWELAQEETDAPKKEQAASLAEGVGALGGQLLVLRFAPALAGSPVSATHCDVSEARLV